MLVSSGLWSCLGVCSVGSSLPLEGMVAEGRGGVGMLLRPCTASAGGLPGSVATQRGPVPSLPVSLGA